MSLPPEILSTLRAEGLIRSQAPTVTPLAGGVSCDIWRVEDEGRVFAVKRALPKLRVQAEWFADISRNRHEQEYLRYVGSFLPGAVPRILFSDRECDFFAMEFLGGEFSDWKKSLLAGKIDPEIAATAGATLGRIHGESWHDIRAAELFNTDRNFHDLRVEPYLLAAAERNDAIASLIRAEAARLSSTKKALVHGDYSPKNLMVAGGRLVVLDCEVAWFGDPAFDLCFLLNHLLLKALHLPGDAEEFLGLASRALSAYESELGQARFETVAASAPALLLCLMLARVDGKSPVEYLTCPERKEFIRAFVHANLPSPPAELPALFSAWKRALPQ